MTRADPKPSLAAVAELVVAASMVALERGGVVCIPTLEDADLLTSHDQAENDVVVAGMRPALAQRLRADGYRPPVGLGIVGWGCSTLSAALCDEFQMNVVVISRGWLRNNVSKSSAYCSHYVIHHRNR